MRIGVDATTWTNRRGYGRFTRGIVRSMVADFPEHTFILLTDAHTAHEAEFPDRAVVHIVKTGAQQAVAASASGSRTIMDVARMGRAAASTNVDVFLFPTTFSYFPIFARTPVVTVMHDASAENRPDLIFPSRIPRMLWQAKTWMARKQTTELVTVSAAARTQISTTFKIPLQSISVVGEGTDEHFRVIDFTNIDTSESSIRQRFGLPRVGHLVLYVGGISPHKNLQSLLQAMAVSSGNWHLAFVGDHTNDNFLGCYRELVNMAAALDVSNRVTFTGFVSDSDLALLYNVATLFVSPSLAEGFGLPVLEAMSCGLPVAVSNATSLPEVVGDAGQLFEPTSPANIAAVIDDTLADVSLRQELRRRGLHRAAQFSWRSAAKTMMQILENAPRSTVGTPHAGRNR